MQLDLSLVLACYNEAEHLMASVREICGVLDGTRLAYELIFVDDCSVDATRNILEEIVSAFPNQNMVVSFHAENTGRGKAVCDGFRLARGRIVGYIDVDLEVHAHYIPSCVRAIEGGADAAYAVREYKLKPSLLHRHVLSRVYANLVDQLLDVGLADTESGYKFFRRDKLLPLLDQATDPGWFWDTQIMTYWVMAGYSVAEIPALFVRRSDKVSTVRVVSDSTQYLVKLLSFHRDVQARRGEHGDSLPGRVAAIYSQPLLYKLLMRLLYGRHFHDRYAAIAAEIPPGSRVVDVCMGDGALFVNELRSKSVTYLGLDRSPAMVDWARKRGINASQFDVRVADLPECDVAVIQGSLYQFLPNERGVVEKLLHAARHKVVVSEPVVNLSASSSPWLAAISQKLTNPDPSRPYSGQRFDPESLDTFFRSFNAFQGSRRIAGGRECMGVFAGQRRA